MQTDAIREKFLSFFKSKRHRIIESDSLVPCDDATILFTPAGMNQFKKQFLGFSAGFSRAATCQRCLRTDDLDKVGKTPSHHTFFEMLGNFSFGDYFKGQAIAFAWEFLTDELGIKKDRLWASVYKDDDEAYGIWEKKIKLAAAKIIRLGDKENFWPAEAKEKGPNGPCGPCSEIFFDQGSNIGCARADCNPSCKCGRFVEVWNLVFTQYNRKENGRLEPLPKKNIDTGMGLERLSSVMQGVKSNFETDLFKPIVKEICRAIKDDVYKDYALIYPVADHIRAVAFAIHDGVLPSNENRGYVVRKLIRKSSLHLKGMGITKPFLYKLVPIVSSVMRVPYPGLAGRKEDIAQVILAEEKNFISTLDSSDALLQERFSTFTNNPHPLKAALAAFKLYDTYGIPFELTKAWLDKQGIPISQDAFHRELERQKARSKSQSRMVGDVFEHKGLGFGVKPTEFLGYKEYSTQAEILKIIQDNRQVRETARGKEATIILGQTVFYPESGGQVGDTGELRRGRCVFEVLNTKKIDNVIMHIGKVKEGSFRQKDAVSVRIDIPRRISIARNHTATHLLQAALREVLGMHVQQQGSLVAEDRLRFDFTHFQDIGREELDKIEEAVNGYISGNYPLRARQIPLKEARRLGALAFFAEKYQEKVRVVSIGDVSLELCAGTHLDSIGSIGIFKITQESSVASGVRRIEAVTGNFAYKIIKEEEGILSSVSLLLNVPAQRVVPELEKRLAHIKGLENLMHTQRLGALEALLTKILEEARVIKGAKVITQIIEDADADLLRKGVDFIKQKTDSAVIALGSICAGRALLVMGITKDLSQKGLDASKVIRDVASLIGGSGGGRHDFAQAGGSRPENLKAAFLRLEDIINNLE